MRYLTGAEEKEAMNYINRAAMAASQSTCQRHKCGSVIVYGDIIIGTGFNSPPGNRESQRRCSNAKELYNRKITDKTCCVHAEQRAIMNALKNNSMQLLNSRIYFVRLDWNGDPAKSGKPYCTICSKMALDVGIGEFVLWNDEGICVYTTEEYNTLSYQYIE